MIPADCTQSTVPTLTSWEVVVLCPGSQAVVVAGLAQTCPWGPTLVGVHAPQGPCTFDEDHQKEAASWVDPAY